MDFIAFSIGNIDIYWYGLIIVGAILLGLLINKIFFKLYQEKMEPLFNLLVWAMPSSLIGARILYVIIHKDIYVDNLLNIFCIWQGGLSIYGALIGFFVASIVFFYKNNYDMWKWLDLLIPSIIFGLIIMQITNFMMQFSVGIPLGLDIPNDHSLAEYIEYKYRPTGFEAYQYFQPVALYQAFLYTIILIITSLLLIFNKKYKYLAKGTIFLASILSMAIVRFYIGFMYLSVDKDMIFYPMQWIALVVIVLTTIIYVMKRKQKI